MKEGKKKIIKLKRIFATILAVAMLVTNANIPVLAYDGTDDPPTTENNLEGEGLPEVSEGEAAVPEVASDENTESIADNTLANENPQGSELSVTNIAILTPPTKSDYTVGIDSEIDYSGLEIQLDYSDGSSELISDGSTVTASGQELIYNDGGIDWNTKDSRDETITVTSGDISTEFQIHLLAEDPANTLISLEVSVQPTIQDYVVGTSSAWLYDGMRVKALYANGDSEEIEPFMNLRNGDYLDWNHNVELDVAGTYAITVTDFKKNISISADIRVHEEDEYIKLFNQVNIGENTALDIPEGLTTFVFTAPETGDYSFHFYSDIEIEYFTLRLHTLTNDYITDDYDWQETELSINSSLEQGHSYLLSIESSTPCTSNITCDKLNQITEIQIVSPPSISKYPVGFSGNYDYRGARAKVFFKNGDPEEVLLYDHLADGRNLNWWDTIDFNTAGTYQLTASYQEVSDSIEIEVLETEDYVAALPLLTFGKNSSISLPAGITQFTFTAPESGDYHFSAHYDMPIESSITLNELTGGSINENNYSETTDPSVTGTLVEGQTYVLTFTNAEACTTDIICENLTAITGIQLISPPSDSPYLVGSSYYGYSGMLVEVTFNNGDSEVLGYYDSLKDGRILSWDDNIDFYTAGKYQITVSYGDISMSTDVTVLTEEEYLKTFSKLNIGENTALNLSEGSNKFIFTAPESGDYSMAVHYDAIIDSSIKIEDINGYMDNWNPNDQSDSLSFNNYLEKNHSYLITLETSSACTADITCQKLKNIIGLQVISLPEITRYPVGYTGYNNYYGMRVKVLFEDDSFEEVGIYASLSDGRSLSWDDNVNLNIPGTYEITASYGDLLKTSALIEVLSEEDYAKTMTPLDFGKDTTLTLQKGITNFVFSVPKAGDYSLNIHFSKDVNNYASVKTITSSAIADSYGDNIKLGATFEKGQYYILSFDTFEPVTVDIHWDTLSEIKKLELVSPPSITQYPVGYWNSYERGMKVKATLADGTSQLLYSYSSLTDGRDLSWNNDVDYNTPGTYHITASYGKLQVSAEIEIMELSEYLSSQDHLALGNTNGVNIQEGIKRYIFTPSESGDYRILFCHDSDPIDSDVRLLDLNGDYIDSGSYYDNADVAFTSTLEKDHSYIVEIAACKPYVIDILCEKLPAITGLELVAPPSVTQYPLGYSNADIHAGMKVKVLYEDGSSEITDSDHYLVNGRYLRWNNDINYNEVGIYHVTAAYADFLVSANVSIVDEESYIASSASLVLGNNPSISLQEGMKNFVFTAPDDGDYQIQLNYDTQVEESRATLTDLAGSELYNNWVPQTFGFTVDGTLEKGKTYILSLKNTNACTVDITCKKLPKITKLELLSPPHISRYPVGYSGDIDYDGMSLKVIMEDGSSETLNPYEALNDGRSFTWNDDINCSKANTYHITVSYKNLSATTAIDIINEQEYITSLDQLVLGENPYINIPNGTKQFLFKAPQDGSYRMHMNYSTDISSRITLKSLKGDFIDSIGSSSIASFYLDGDLEKGQLYILTITSSQSCTANIIFETLKKIKDIQLVSPPIVTSYPVGYTFSVNYSGMRVKVLFEDDTFEELEAYDILADGRYLSWYDNVDFDTTGSYQISVSYKDVVINTFAIVNVLSQEDYINSLPKLELEKDFYLELPEGYSTYKLTVPTSNQYVFNVENLLNDGSTCSLSIFNITGEDISSQSYHNYRRYVSASLEAGRTYLLKFFNNDTAYIHLNSYKANEIKSLKVLSPPFQQQYMVTPSTNRLDIDYTGLSVQVTYSNGETEVLARNDKSKDGLTLSFSCETDGTVPGKYPVTVSLGDFKTTYDIQVLSQKDYLNTLDTLTLGKEKQLTFEKGSQSYTLKYTPEKDGEYILTSWGSLTYNAGENLITTLDGSIVPYYENYSGVADVALKGGTTYLFQLTLHTPDTMTYLLTRQESATSLTIVSPPKTTMVLSTMSYYDISQLKNGLKAKVTYADGRTEVFSGTQADENGRQLSLDTSKVLWSQPGTYPVTVIFNNVSATFDIQVVDGNKYFYNPTQLSMSSNKGHIDAGVYNNYYFIPKETRSYLFTLSTDATNFPPLNLLLYNSNYERLYPKMVNITVSAPRQYSITLEKGQKYYVNISNQSATIAVPFDLNIEILDSKTIKELRVKQLPSNTTRVVGAEFRKYYPYDGVIEAVQEDGSSKVLDQSNYYVNVNYNAFKAGTYKQTISVQAKTTSFNLKVVAPKDYKQTKVLTLNQFTEITSGGLVNNPIYLYSFTPTTTKEYYLTLNQPNEGSITDNFRLLSETGDILKTGHSSQNDPCKLTLNKNQTYYIAAYFPSFSKGSGISINDQQLNLSCSTNLFAYTGAEVKPSIDVTLNGKPLTKDKDYKIYYFNNVKTGTGYAEVTAFGKQNFAPAKYFFSILTRKLRDISISTVPDQAYTGKEVKPKITAKYNNILLEEETDYSITYSNNIDEGVAWLTIYGQNNFEGSIVKRFTIKKGNTIKYELNGGANSHDNPDVYGNADVTLKNPSRKNYTFAGWYTDKDFKTKITTIKGGANKNYTLYAKWTEISVGRVTGLAAVSSSTTSTDFKWAAVTGADGYLIDYASGSSFTGKTSIDTIKNTASISKLSSGSTRYVRVRAYTLDSTGEKVYGSYSSSITLRTKPAAPAITKITGGANKITLTWGDVAGDQGYQIYMATSQNGTYSKVTTTLANATSYTKTGLKTAATYYFKVRAYNKSGTTTQYGSYSAVSYGPTSPAAPAISKATGGTKSVTLTWKDVSGESGYQIYMSTSQNGTYSKAATAKANATSYTIKNLSAAKTYYFKIRAYRSANSVAAYSSFSSIKSAATRTAAPVISSVTGGAGKATVKWKTVSGASGYVVYMATSAGGTYKNIGSVKSGTTSFTKTGLSAAKNYYFKVKAYRSAGGSNVYSSDSSYKWCGTAASTPAISKITAGTKKISLQWKNVSGESGYQVYMATSKNGTYSKIATPKTNSTSYTKSGLTKGKTYYFKVRSYRKVNGQTVYSSFSSVKSAKAK